jgi:hypothetical protein
VGHGGRFSFPTRSRPHLKVCRGEGEASALRARGQGGNLVAPERSVVAVLAGHGLGAADLVLLASGTGSTQRVRHRCWQLAGPPPAAAAIPAARRLPLPLLAPFLLLSGRWRPRSSPPSRSSPSARRPSLLPRLATDAAAADAAHVHHARSCITVCGAAPTWPLRTCRRGGVLGGCGRFDSPGPTRADVL